jgi:hypothetical protein
VPTEAQPEATSTDEPTVVAPQLAGTETPPAIMTEDVTETPTTVVTEEPTQEATQVAPTAIPTPLPLDEQDTTGGSIPPMAWFLVGIIGLLIVTGIFAKDLDE